jgi:arylsulfatase A-like enzyme
MPNFIHTLRTLLAASALLSGLCTTETFAARRPNVVLVFIDDMGWADFSCFGNKDATTPNIDALAKEGIRFRQFYVNSPICSPSRVAISTGQYPHRHRITSYLNNRKGNKDRGVADWLDPKVPMLARHLQNAGYATGHFGKWHMGGQRDVADAPPITAYGFDDSLTNFEGMGAKLLPLTEKRARDGSVEKGKIWGKAEILGGPVTWTLRSRITGGFVERAVGFIDKAQAAKKPFYINLWPDDVHGPWFPSVKRWSEDQRERYLAVLEEMDRQFKVLFDRIKNDAALRDNTLILICSDNGPAKDSGSAGPFKGYKAQLFEGGIRSSLVAWAPGLMDKKVQGMINTSSVFCAMDLVPSTLNLADVSTDAEFDGEDLSDVLLGKSTESRKAPIFFRRPPDRKSFYGTDNLPDFAMRSGQWKLLCDYGGKNTQLFNLEKDLGESTNLADRHPDIVGRMTQSILSWNATMPIDAGDPSFSNAR